MKHLPCVWLTGLSGAGKSTIAYRLVAVLRQNGRVPLLIDGDILRNGLNSDLAFSIADRAENVRRAAELARLVASSGVLPVVALISPMRAERSRAKDIIGADHFIEVFVDTPLELCEVRDPKGLYRQARKGLIKEFTGISSPYEPPALPQIRLDTQFVTPDQCVLTIMDYLDRII